MATITAESIEVRDPADLPEAFARAFEIFTSRRPRPVHIGIPIDVLDLPAASWERLPPRGSTPRPDAALVERAVELLAGAERPMLLLGGGAVAAGAEAAAVAERLGAPVGITVNAKGVLPDSHPLSLGTSLTLRPVHAAFTDADVVLAVGTEFSETDYFYAPGAAAPDFAGALIRIDIDADQLHKQRRATVGLQGDAKATLAAIDAGLAARGRERSGSAERAEELRGGRLWPGADKHLPFLAALERRAEDAIVVADSTQPAYVAHHAWPGRGRAPTSRPAASARSAPRCRWRSARRSPLPAAPSSHLRARRRAVHDPRTRKRRRSRPADRARDLAERRLRRDARLDGSHRVPRIGTEISSRDFVKLAEGFGCPGVRRDAGRPARRARRPTRPIGRRSSRCAARPSVTNQARGASLSAMARYEAGEQRRP